MNLFNPSEMVENYCAASIKKSKLPFSKMAVMSILAGILIAFGGVVTNTATMGLKDAGMVRMVSGLLFPFGLGMVILSGAELFTGNCLMSIGILDHKINAGGILRNLVCVYIGNFIGAILVSFCMAKFGQLSIGSGALAVASIKTTAAKCSMPFANAFVQGIFCNMLVCLAVLFSLSSKDVAGRILGAYIPVCFFVLIGFNHSIADMYYGTVGIFALNNRIYADMAAKASVDVTNVTWGSYFLNNMIPVTLGNIVGGVLIGFVMWYAHKQKQ